MNNSFFLGYSVNFKDICFIYPPTVTDVSINDNYGQYNKVLTLSQEEIEDIFVEAGIGLENLLTPLEYLLNNAFNNQEFDRVVKQAFMFFIHEDVTLLYTQKKILIGKIADITDINTLRIIDETNFFDFQNLIREACALKGVEPPNPNEHPRIKAMKAKQRYRDKVKAKQKNGITFSDILASICCTGIGITPLNIGKLSYVALSNLFETYQRKEKYENDIKFVLVGADSKKIKMQYWIGKTDN